MFILVDILRWLAVVLYILSERVQDLSMKIPYTRHYDAVIRDPDGSMWQTAAMRNVSTYGIWKIRRDPRHRDWLFFPIAK